MLHSTAETNPHDLYSIQSGSSNLQPVERVSAKLSLGPEGNTASSATSRLKERRELEEARKTEHRTVMLNSGPALNKARPVASTSKLKLRAKGLAPAATSIPLIRSRAGTPNETFSLPGSPNLAAVNRIVMTPPSTSAALQNSHNTTVKASPLGHSKDIAIPHPNLRKRLIQILAIGPISRRNIVQQLHHPEPAVLTLLHQVAQAAPEHLQPPVEASKKFSGPVNRRSSAQVSAPTISQNGDRGSNTRYILKDDEYRHVSIKEWTEYSAKERQSVSEHMEEALKRIGLPKNAEEWKRLYPDGRSIASDVHLKTAIDGTDDETIPDLLLSKSHSHSSSSIDSPSKTDGGNELMTGKQTIKKNSTMDRLKKAAKGRGSTKSSAPSATTSKAPGVKKSKSDESSEGAVGTKMSEVEHKIESKSDATPASSSPVKPPEPASVKKVEKASKTPPSRSGVTQKKTASTKVANRRDIEYTDSSEDDKMQLDTVPVRCAPPSKPISKSKVNNVAVARSSSMSLDGKKIRHGVGSGAAFSREPWLDVRSRGDWERLAERFKRVYEDFIKGRNLLREEEDKIRVDLEEARLEPKVIPKEPRVEDEGEVKIEEELEEGEASPRNGTARGMSAMSIDPSIFTNVIWRSSPKKGSDKVTSEPMSYEELETHILKLKETEAQLIRMKGALKTSKKMLEANADS